MRFRDLFSWSMRHSRQRIFESILIVLAIGLGVSVIVAIGSLFMNVQSSLLNMDDNEYMRTFNIYSSANFGSYSSTDPVLKVVQEKKFEPLQLSLEELADIQQSLPVGMHVYIENTYGTLSPSLPKEQQDEQEASDMPVYESYAPVGYTGTVVIGVVETGAETKDETIADIEVDWQEQTIRYEQAMQAYDNIYLTACTPGYFAFKDYTLASGNWFMASDIAQQNPVVVISDKLAKRIFGTDNPIGQLIPVDLEPNQVHYEVIGVLDPLSEDDEMMRFGQDLFGLVPATSAPYMLHSGYYNDTNLKFDNFTIGVEVGQELAQAAEIIQTEIRLRYGEQATINNFYLSMNASNESELYIYYLIIGIFASLGLIIAIINILNLMLARVLRRTKSIGLSIALGSSKRLVFRQFLIEALLLGLTGAFIGIALSYGFIALLENLTQAEIEFGLKSILLGCGLGVVVSLLFGVYPAYLGSQTNPVDALRNE